MCSLSHGHLGCCWQSHVTYYIKSGRLRDALTVYLDMSAYDSAKPNPPTLVALIKACTKLKDLDTALHIHAHATKLGFTQHNMFVGSSLIDLYAKCGSLPKAHQVFGNLHIRDVVLWTTLIAGNIENGFCEEALLCFELMCSEGIFPNATTYVCCLKACGNVGSLVKGQGFHVEIARQGISEIEQAVGNALVNMYVKCGLLNKAQEVLMKLPIRDVISWTALMVGYVDHGDNNQALVCLEQMRLEGIAPNAITFACSIKACTCSRAIEKGQDLHAEIERQKISFSENGVGLNLVDMYAKWGFFAQAWQVFDKISTHDVDLWNVFIAGYLEHGHGKQSIKCFQSMLNEGIHPNPVTYVYILRACGSLGDICGGQELHAEIERKELLSEDKVLGNTLVDMYAKCGRLVLALQVFSKLPVRDQVSWTALIEGYAMHEYDDKALKCFKEMQLEGVSPNAVTLACLVKACGNLRAIKKGQAVHAHVEKLGLLKKALMIWNSLIIMYFKCGSIVSALSLFHKLPVQDVVSWTALIAGYTEYGLGEQALHCIEQMQIEGNHLNAATFSCGFKACSISGALDKGRQMHAVMEIQGLLKDDNIIGNTLVDMYVELGQLEVAKKAFDRIPHRDAVSWSTLMAGYAEQGQGEEVLDCYEQLQVEGVSLDPVVYISCLKLYGRLGGTAKGQEIHAEIERLGLLETDSKIGSALVDMYARRGLLGFSQEVFDKVPVQNVVVWNALIAGYARQGHAKEAFNCFKSMQQEGISPNVVTLVCLLKACGSIGVTDKGQDLHGEIERQGLMESNSVACSSVVDMYAKCGFLEKAQQVCAKLPCQHTVVWNTAITAFATHKQYIEALMCLENMQLEGITPNLTTYVCSLKVCGDIGATEKGQEIHMQIERRGMLGNNAVGAALVNMYAKCNMLVEAHQVVDRLVPKDAVSWTALMAGYAQLGKGKAVVSVFHSMLGEGVKPDAVTFSAVLGACSRACLSNVCWTYFEAMSKDYGFLPSHDHLAWVVDVLGRVGLVDDAIKITMQKAVHSNVSYFSILNVCENWGRNVFGAHSFESALCRG